MDGSEPDIPVYKVIECTGPTNTRVYKVAVYFRGKRLASASGHSIQQAEMEAAKTALENSSALFPQLDYQKRVIANSMKRQKGKQYDDEQKRNRTELHRIAKKIAEDDSHLPKQYRVNEKSNKQSSDESDSKYDSDGKNSYSSDVSHATSKSKRVKHNKKHRKKSREKGDKDDAQSRDKDENKQDIEIKQEIQNMQEKLETQIKQSALKTTPDLIENDEIEENLEDSMAENYSDVENASLESGEIP